MFWEPKIRINTIKGDTDITGRHLYTIRVPYICAAQDSALFVPQSLLWRPLLISTEAQLWPSVSQCSNGSRLKNVLVNKNDRIFMALNECLFHMIYLQDFKIATNI